MALPNKSYVHGRDAEYQIAKIFEDAGFEVTRAAGSHSTFDLVASKITPKNVYKVYVIALMQVKRKKRKQ